jgi:hypothetical protein
MNYRLFETEDDLDIYDDIENEVDFENEYEDAFLEGYLDALNEMRMNPLPIIGGGDVKGDIMSIFGLGNGPDRAAAIKNYLDAGNTIKGGLIGGTYGTKAGMLYRNNKYLPGGSNIDAESTSLYLQSLFLKLKPEDRKKVLNILKTKLR